MAKRKYSEVEMIGALKQMEAGRSAAEVGRELGVSKHTVYAWKAKYGGMRVALSAGCFRRRLEGDRPMRNLPDEPLQQNSPVENCLSIREVGPPLPDVYELDPLRDHRWPSFLQRHPQASVFHSVGWLEALHRTYGYEPVAFTTSPPTSDLKRALLFCRIRSWLTGHRIVSLPFSDHCAPLCDWDVELKV